MVVEMTYNSARRDLVIPEYGRTIQEMVDHLKSIVDKEERNKCAAAIVSVMGSVVAQEGDADEVQKNCGASCSSWRGTIWTSTAR